VWDCELDIYGNVRTIEGSKTFIPFRYQGQYEDEETGLYYNRFRYYSADSGTYISQDPIGILGDKNQYSYVHDVNDWVDIYGLAPWPNGKMGEWWDNPATAKKILSIILILLKMPYEECTEVPIMKNSQYHKLQKLKNLVILLKN